jgi:hypothetical protein
MSLLSKLFLTQVSALSLHLSKTLDSDPSPSWNRGIGHWPEKDWIPFFDLDIPQNPEWVLGMIGIEKGTDIERELTLFLNQKEDSHRWKLVFYSLCLAKDWQWKRWSETTFLQPLWDLKLEQAVSNPILEIKACLRQLQTVPDTKREVWSPFNHATLAEQLPPGLQTSINVLLTQDNAALKQGTIRAGREFLRRFFQTFFSIVDHYKGLVQRFMDLSSEPVQAERLFHNLHQTQKVVMIFLQACNESVVLNTRLQWARYCALSGLVFAAIPSSVTDKGAIIKSAKKARGELIELFRDKEGLDFELMPRLEELENLLISLQSALQGRLGEQSSEILDWVLLHDHSKDTLKTLAFTRQQTLDSLSAEFKDFAFFLAESDRSTQKQYRVFSTMLAEWCGDDKERPFAGQCVYVSRNLQQLVWAYFRFLSCSEVEKKKHRKSLSQALVQVVGPFGRLIREVTHEAEHSPEAAAKNLRWITTFLNQFQLAPLLPLVFQSLSWGLKSRAFERIIDTYHHQLDADALPLFKTTIGEAISAYSAKSLQPLTDILGTSQPKSGKKWNSVAPLNTWSAHCRSYVLQLPISFWKTAADGKNPDSCRQETLLEAVVMQCEPKSYALDLLENLTAFWPERSKLVLMIWLANKQKAIPKRLLPQHIQLESVIATYMKSTHTDFLEQFWLSHQFYYPLGVLKHIFLHAEAKTWLTVLMHRFVYKKSGALNVFSNVLVSIADDPVYIEKLSGLWMEVAHEVLTSAHAKKTVWNMMIQHFRKTSARERIVLAQILHDWASFLRIEAEEIGVHTTLPPHQLLQETTPLVSLCFILRNIIKKEDDLKWDGITLSFSEEVKHTLLSHILAHLETWMTFMPFMVTHELSMTISRLKKQDFKGIVGTLSTFKSITAQALKAESFSKDTVGFLKTLELTLENLVTISDLWGSVTTLLDSDVPDFMADKWQNQHHVSDPLITLLSLLLSFDDHHSSVWCELWIKAMIPYRPDWVSHWMKELTDPAITAIVLTRLISLDDTEIQEQLLADIDLLVNKSAWALTLSSEAQRSSNQKLARVFHHVTKGKEKFANANRLFFAYLNQAPLLDDTAPIFHVEPEALSATVLPQPAEPLTPPLFSLTEIKVDYEKKYLQHGMLIKSHKPQHNDYSWSGMAPHVYASRYSPKRSESLAAIPSLTDIKKAYTVTWDTFSSQVPSTWSSPGFKAALKIGACWYLMLVSQPVYRRHWTITESCLTDVLSSRDLSRFTSKTTRRSGLWRHLYLKRLNWEYHYTPIAPSQENPHHLFSLFRKQAVSDPADALVVLLNSLNWNQAVWESHA